MFGIYYLKVIKYSPLFFVLPLQCQKDIRARDTTELIIKKKTMARRFGLMIGGRSTQPCIANEARKQMALINKCKMHLGGKGVANQPFYVKFLNR